MKPDVVERDDKAFETVPAVTVAVDKVTMA